VFCSYGSVPCPPVQANQSCCGTQSSRLSGEVECATGRADWAHGIRGCLIWGIPIADFAHKPRYGHALSGYRVARTSDVHGRDVLTQCPPVCRIHCYFTGPFFLVLAGVALLYGVGWLPLGAKGWSTLSRLS